MHVCVCVCVCVCVPFFPLLLDDSDSSFEAPSVIMETTKAPFLGLIGLEKIELSWIELDWIRLDSIR